MNFYTTNNVLVEAIQYTEKNNYEMVEFLTKDKDIKDLYIRCSDWFLPGTFKIIFIDKDKNTQKYNVYPNQWLVKLPSNKIKIFNNQEFNILFSKTTHSNKKKNIFTRIKEFVRRILITW